MRLGIDVGSTTVKIVLIDENEKVIYQRYERHMSSVFDKVRELLEDLIDTVGDIDVKCVITGSGGLALAEKIGARFEQEVVTCSLAVEKLIPQTDVAIELGGEDAKITYFGSAIEQRMNGTCAGGTGAFIDQMAILLSTDGEGLKRSSKKIRSDISNCGQVRRLCKDRHTAAHKRGCAYCKSGGFNISGSGQSDYKRTWHADIR